MIIASVTHVRVFALNSVYGIDYKASDIRFRSVRVEFFDTVSVFIVALWIHDVVNIDHKPAILARFTSTCIWHRLQ